MSRVSDGAYSISPSQNWVKTRRLAPILAMTRVALPDCTLISRIAATYPRAIDDNDARRPSSGLNCSAVVGGKSRFELGNMAQSSSSSLAVDSEASTLWGVGHMWFCISVQLLGGLRCLKCILHTSKIRQISLGVRSQFVTIERVGGDAAFYRCRCFAALWVAASLSASDFPNRVPLISNRSSL